MKIKSNGLTFEVESRGDANEPAVLLTMGLGMQLTAWPEALLDALVMAGYRVITYDNRDIGLSSHLNEMGVPSIAWSVLKSKFGFKVKSPYELQAMADDALGIVDALGLERVHVVGVSMGGMISQRIAITAPKRVLSLTSVMSSSGAPKLPPPRSDVLRALTSKPKSKRPEDVAKHALETFKLIGSTGFKQDWQGLYEQLLQSVNRSYNPSGVARQLLAVAADKYRYQLLAQIKCPTLVIHGTVDPLVPIACGKDTASRIAGACFVPIEGMGHDWPPSVTEQLCKHIVPHLSKAQSAAVG